MMQKILQQYLLNDFELYAKVCKVDAVNDMSCDCSPVDGDAPIKNVRLTADFDNDNKWVLIPKVGSFVVVSFFDKAMGFVSMVNEVDKIYYKNGDTVFQVDENFLFSKGETKLQVDDKFLFKNASQDLLTLMKDLIDLNINEKHMTNQGPTISLTPDSLTQYQLIKTRFEALLKDS